MILLTNIGNKHLKIDKEILNKINLKDLGFNENIELIDKNGFINKQYFLQFTEYLNNNFEKFKKYISVNILDKVINKFNIIYIFTINQPGTCNSQDAKYEGEIIKRLFPDKQIILQEYVGDPTDRKKVFTFFLNFIKYSNNFEGEKVYILGSGGFSIMEEELNMAGIIHVDNCILLSVNEKNGEIQESEIGKMYLKEIDKKIILNLLDYYGYKSILKILRNTFIEDEQLENFVKYCFYRFNSDFEKSNEIYKKYLEKNLKLEERGFNWIVDQKNHENTEERKKVFDTLNKFLKNRINNL